MKVLFLYFLVFFSGGCVLALEILGTRVLGPYYGVSLFLWSALISVTLLSLSLGYALGGRIADRRPQMKVLLGILLLAGVSVLAIPILESWVVGLLRPLGLRAQVFFSSFILFSPPLMLLGMVSPFAIRLRVEALSGLGKTAGDLAAISTVGSVIAAVLTGFYFIPLIGVSKLVLSIAVVLLLLAGLGFLLDRKVAGAGTSVALLALAVLFPFNNDGVNEHTLYFKDSAYGQLHVRDNGKYRTFFIDRVSHSEIYSGTEVSALPYTYVVDGLRASFEIPGRLLLVGLGAGIVANDYERAGWEVTVIEIDPDVTDAARKFFDFKVSEPFVHHMDGRRFLQETRERYDLIVLDAFGSSSVPFHLLTDEVFHLISKRLRPGGKLALNVIVENWDSPLLGSVFKTLQKNFPQSVALPTHSSTGVGNVVMVTGEVRAVDKAEILGDVGKYQRQIRSQQVWSWERRFIPKTKDSLVVTDDLNPVDVWSDEINVELQKILGAS